MEETIKQTLRRLGITRNYRGYNILLVAVQLVLEDESRIRSVMEEVYRPTAKIVGCNFPSIERNIRTIIDRVWNMNKQSLIRIADFPMSQQPTAAELIDIIASHVRRTCRTKINK